MSQPGRRSPHAPLAVLLVALLTLDASGGAWGQAAAGVSVELSDGSAGADAPGVSLNVRASEGPARVNLVVTHEDVLLGTVVDRVVPLDIGAGGSADVLLADLRLDTGFSVRVLPRDAPLPMLPNVTGVFDGRRIDEMPEVARVEVQAPRLARDAPHPVAAYPFVAGDAARWPDVLALSTGEVVVGYTNQTGHLVLRVSRDGGHAFGPEREVAPQAQDNMSTWRFAEVGEGRVALLHQVITGWDGNVPTRDPWTFVLFDPTSEQVLSSEPILGGGEAAQDAYMPAMALLPDGSALFAFEPLDTSDGGYRSAGNLLHVWRFLANGSAQLQQELALPERAGPGLHIGVSSAGDVAMVGSFDAGVPGGRLWYARSADGGLTFDAPTAVKGVLDEPGNWGYAESLVVTPGGTLVMGVNDVDLRDQLLVRVEGDNTTSRTVGPADSTAEDYAVLPVRLVADDARVWAFWFVNDDNASERSDLWGMESTDGGATFGSAYRLRASNVQGRLYQPEGLALLPDGRPLLVASTYSDGYAALPLFDPMPALDVGLTRVEARVEAPPAPEGTDAGADAAAGEPAGAGDAGATGANEPATVDDAAGGTGAASSADASTDGDAAAAAPTAPAEAPVPAADAADAAAAADAGPEGESGSIATPGGTGQAEPEDQPAAEGQSATPGPTLPLALAGVLAAALLARWRPGTRGSG